MAIFSRILYAVKDTDPRRPHPFAKAIALAKACRASLDLFHAVSAPLYLPEPGTEVAISSLKRDTLDLHRARLEKLATRARRHGIEVTCTVCWDHPPHEAIVRHARETDADLVVADCHTGRGSRWLMHFTDWELIRSSELPVLLLRDPRPYRQPAILAAVDPVHAHSKPLELDESILTAGRALAAILRGKLHVVHANHPPLHSLASDTPFTIEDARAIGRREFEKLMSRSDMAARRGHLRDGDPAKVIPEVADDIHARVVVMGAVSRSGLKRLFIGNTAERVFGKLACDVLVVKPTVFRKRVPAAHREVPVLTPAPVSVLAH